MAARLEYWKRGRPPRGWYSVDSAELAALKPGQTVYLREGSSATFEAVEQSPSQQTVAAIIYPDGISFINPTVNLEFTTDPQTAAEWWIAAAEKLAPSGAYALSQRSPLGALTRPGKLLRSIDAAQAERDPEKKRVLAGVALREARTYAGKPAPAATAPALPKASEAPATSEGEKPASSTPWGLIAGGILLTLAVLGSAGSGQEEDDDG